MERQILTLFADYIKHVEQITDDLRHTFSVSNLLSGVHSGKIPRSGTYNSFGGGEYVFHGVGCRIRTAEIEIDFDFGPDGTVPGADPWKLFDFAVMQSHKYQWLPDRKQFNLSIENLIGEGYLRRSNLLPNLNLLLLVVSSGIRS